MPKNDSLHLHFVCENKQELWIFKNYLKSSDIMAVLSLCFCVWILNIMKIIGAEVLFIVVCGLCIYNVHEDESNVVPWVKWSVKSVEEMNGKLFKNLLIVIYYFFLGHLLIKDFTEEC